MIFKNTTYRLLITGIMLIYSTVFFAQERFNQAVITSGITGSLEIEKVVDGYVIIETESNGTDKYNFRKITLDGYGNLISVDTIKLGERIAGIPFYCNKSYFISGVNDSLQGVSSVYKPYLARLNNINDTLWTLHLTDFTYDAFFNNPIYVGGDKMMVGGSYKDNLGQYKLFLSQIDTNGNEIWRKTYPYGSNDQILNLLAQAPDGGYILSGGTKSWGNGGMDRYVMKVDSNGDFEWHNWWGGTDGESGACRPLKDRNYLVYGAEKNSQGQSGTHVMKIDSLGNELWSNYLEFNPDQSDGLRKFIELENGDLVFIGFTVDTTLTKTNGMLFRLNAEGQLLWKREYNLRPYNHYFEDFVQTDDGGFAIVGFLSGDGMGLDQDAWLVKVDSMGCDDVPLCYLGERELGLEVSILKTYPNPTTDYATIELKENSKELEIYNVNGQLIESIQIQNQQFSYSLNLNSYENGIYILRLKDKFGATIGQAKIIKK